MPMNPNNLSEIYGQLIGFPITVILIFFLPLFLFITFKLKNKNAKPLVKTLFFVGYPLIVLLIFFDVINSPIKFQQICNDLAGFHGKPFPRGEGISFWQDSAIPCSENCKVLLLSGRVLFVEEELARNQRADMYRFELKFMMKQSPGKYKYFIFPWGNPKCKGYNKFLAKDETLFGVAPVFDEFCITWERIEKFNANFEYAWEPAPIEGSLAIPIEGTKTFIKETKTGQDLKSYYSFSMGVGKIERILNLSLVGRTPPVASCGGPSPGPVKMILFSR